MNTILIFKTRRWPRWSPRSRFVSLAAGALMLVFAFTISSCHTARGFGRDVEEVGEEIQESTAHH
jgi:predicted small secreted protein